MANDWFREILERAEPLLPYTVRVRRILRETPDGDETAAHEGDQSLAIERAATFADALARGERQVVRLCGSEYERVAGYGAPCDYSISVEPATSGTDGEVR